MPNQPEEVTVDQVTGRADNTWTHNKLGEVRTWKFRLQDDPTEYESYVPLDLTPGPGVTLRGWKGTHRAKGYPTFGIAQNQNGEKPQQQQDEFQRRPEHPDNIKGMRRARAISDAPKYYEVFRTENVQEPPKTVGEMKSALRNIIFWLEALYDDPGQQQLSTEVPADTKGLKNDDEIPF